MILRLSIPTRQALAKLTLPVLIALSCLLMLAGRANTQLADRVRVAVGDGLAPIYAVLSAPLHDARRALADIAGFWSIAAENARLRDENTKLRHWQDVALSLDQENQALREATHYIPEDAPRFITARVIADAGGVYARAVLVTLGPGHGIVRGEVALDERGLAGRVTEVGDRTARVLLLTDLNSRIPVSLEQSHARALVTGTNGPRPRVIFWSEGTQPIEGERVVTSAETGALPSGLPVGTIHYSASNAPEVIPAAALDRIEFLRLFDYGLGRGLIVAPAPKTAAGGPR